MLVGVWACSPLENTFFGSIEQYFNIFLEIKRTLLTNCLYKCKHVKQCVVLVPRHNDIRFMDFVLDLTLYMRTFDFKGERERAFNHFLKIFKEDSGKIFLSIACLQYKQLINFRSLNNRTSRICEASLEALELDRAPLFSRPDR